MKAIQLSLQQQEKIKVMAQLLFGDKYNSISIGYEYGSTSNGDVILEFTPYDHDSIFNNNIIEIHWIEFILFHVIPKIDTRSLYYRSFANPIIINGEAEKIGFLINILYDQTLKFSSTLKDQ